MQQQPFLTGFRFNRPARSQKEYPFSIPAIRKMKRVKLHPAVTFFIGENGSGKSTLVEALAVANRFNPEGGSLNFDFSTRASHSPLHKHLELEKTPGRRLREGYFLRAESYFNVATEIERLDKEGDRAGVGARIINSYGGKSLHEQSHGESFFALMTNRLYGDGLYIFDEPEAALSPSRQMSMLVLIRGLVRNGGNSSSPRIRRSCSPIPTRSSTRCPPTACAPCRTRKRKTTASRGTSSIAPKKCSACSSTSCRCGRISPSRSRCWELSSVPQRGNLR